MERTLKPPKSKDLLAWYDNHARVLPWRINPKNRAAGEMPDPYRIWLSEIMLQQTTVATVKSYFEKFVTTWPTVQDLAKSERDDVLKAWAGLGYYSRARNLKACANMIVSDYEGRFPETLVELKKLPGIGDYTAAAMTSIAFDKHAVVVDGNVERVISRLYAIEKPLPGAKKTIAELAAALTPKKRCGDYAQAMMDLGATICTPKRPACAICVWRESCQASWTNAQEDFPRKAPKKVKPTRYGWAFVAVREDRAILLRQRPDKGLLGGMTEVPGTVWSEEKPKSPFAAAPFQAGWSKQCGTIRHTFTHFHLEVDVVTNVFPHNQKPAKNCWWADEESIADEALPTVMKKILEAAKPGITKNRDFS
ncbi:MAG: A/G-specific adenine glycosylase [Hyphomicrobiales bacterium]